MHALIATETVTIEAPAEIVRAQFGDVGHHERVGPHNGVAFRVLRSDARSTDYEQVTSIGPIKAKQTLRLDDVGSGPLVNTVTGGMLRGGTITFRFDSHTAATVVTAEVRGRAPRPLVPLLRRAVGRQLRAALVEDKTDIEQAGYPR